MDSPAAPQLLHEIVCSAPPDALALAWQPETPDLTGTTGIGTTPSQAELATMTFGELDGASRRIATVAEQVEPGGRVGLLGRNSAPYVAALSGVPRAGRIAVLLNQRLAPQELADQIRRTKTTLVLGDPEELERLAPALTEPNLAQVQLVALDDAVAASVAPADDHANPSENDPAWIIHTSGTTGRPKGATLTHRNLLASARAAAAGRAVAPDDVYLFAFPLCHVANYNVTIHHLSARPVLLMAGFEAGDALDLIEAHSVTTTSLAPTMVTMLLEHPNFSPGRLSSLRRIGYGAAPMAEPLLQQVLATLPEVGLSQGYGMTELAGNAVYLDAAAHQRAATSHPELLTAAGVAAPGTELRIAADGEILARGPQVMAGYWEDPEATAAAIVHGWLHTGDVGEYRTVNDTEYLFIVDRKKDIIVTGGENVASREVVDVVSAHPAVHEAAVVGVPDERWGEAVCAVVSLRDSAAAIDAAALSGQIVELCRARLASYKKPRHVLVRDELPKNPSGKILNRELRDWARQQLDG